MHQNLTHVHKQHSDTLWETPQTPSPHLQSTWETNRHHQTPKDTKKRHLSGHTTSNSLFGCLGTSVSVAWCLLVYVVVLNCPEIIGVGFCEHNNVVYVCLWCLDASNGCIWVFRPSMVRQILYIGKASKGKILYTWNFWNIKIPKPPYISSSKIIGLLHFLKFLFL